MKYLFHIFIFIFSYLLLPNISQILVVRGGNLRLTIMMTLLNRMTLHIRMFVYFRSFIGVMVILSIKMLLTLWYTVRIEVEQLFFCISFQQSKSVHILVHFICLFEYIILKLVFQFVDKKSIQSMYIGGPNNIGI